MADNFVVYSFPRSGRGITMQALRAQGLTCITGDSDVGLDDQRFFFTHDFSGKEEYPHRRKVVLRRDPLYSFCSWFEMNVADGGRPDTWNAFEAAVGNEWIPYWKQFARRHLISQEGSHVRFDYLIHHQWLSISSLCLMAGVKYDNTKAIKPYPERDITQFKHYRVTQFRDIRNQLEPEYSQAGYGR